MFILFGKKLQETKRIDFALTKIFGIGISNAKQICKFLNIPNNVLTQELTELQKLNISTYIKQNFNVELKLKQQISENIETMIAINSVKGFRHRSNLPVRGQRTHSNAQTCRRVKMVLNK
jgi:small subunit ribosomal protein S13